MPKVQLPEFCSVDEQRYKALKECGVADDGLLTKAGVEVKDPDALQIIDEKIPCLVDGKPTAKLGAWLQKMEEEEVARERAQLIADGKDPDAIDPKDSKGAKGAPKPKPDDEVKNDG